MLLLELRDIINQDVYMKISSSLKKYTDTHIRDAVVEDIILKLVKALEPISKEAGNAMRAEKRKRMSESVDELRQSKRRVI